MSYEMIELCYEGDFATITMNCPQRRNTSAATAISLPARRLSSPYIDCEAEIARRT